MLQPPAPAAKEGAKDGAKEGPKAGAKEGAAAPPNGSKKPSESKEETPANGTVEAEKEQPAASE
jgi:hypothetical protein